jgi:phage replication-related protein YjqB (UPF0714/DUF867 family)
MADSYPSFQDLERNEREGEDWIREYVNRSSGVLVMAPHGGWIEPFTSELARAVAGNDFSFYTFQGLKRAGNEALHLTSHRFDEPLGVSAASAARWVVAIHGERSSNREFVMVGGLWTAFRERVQTEFTQAGIPVEGPRDGLEGVNPGNICNRGQTGMGGQLEISEGLRRTLRTDPVELRAFVDLVRGVLTEMELGNLAGGKDAL